MTTGDDIVTFCHALMKVCDDWMKTPEELRKELTPEDFRETFLKLTPEEFRQAFLELTPEERRYTAGLLQGISIVTTGYSDLANDILDL